MGEWRIPAIFNVGDLLWGAKTPKFSSPATL